MGSRSALALREIGIGKTVSCHLFFRPLSQQTLFLRLEVSCQRVSSVASTVTKATERRSVSGRFCFLSGHVPLSACNHDADVNLPIMILQCISFKSGCIISCIYGDKAKESRFMSGRFSVSRLSLSHFLSLTGAAKLSYSKHRIFQFQGTKLLPTQVTKFQFKFSLKALLIGVCVR